MQQSDAGQALPGLHFNEYKEAAVNALSARAEEAVGAVGADAKVGNGNTAGGFMGAAAAAAALMKSVRLI